MAKTISLCIIVKDEADYLNRCLVSYKNLVDEIVVVDTGSTDNCIEVAKSHGAKVFETPWENDFAKARNVSLENATSDWIVWTDADDFLEEENAKKIEIIRDKYELNCCFSFMIKNSTDGVLGSVFNQVRMFPNKNAIRFRFKVHEQVLPSIQELNFETVYTDIMVIHTGYSNPEIVKKKQIRNLEILDIEMKERGDNPVIIYSYAGNLVDLERFEEAIPYYEKARVLAIETKSEEHIKEGVPLALAALYGRMKRYSDSKHWVDIAYAHDSSHPQANSILGELLEIDGKLEEAAKYFEFVLTCEEIPRFIPVDVNMLKINACSHLGGLYMKLQKHDKLVAVLDLALEIKNGKKILPSEKGDEYFNKGEYLKAGTEYLKAINDESSKDYLSYLGMAKIFIVDNSPQDAIDILNLGLENFQGNIELQGLLDDLNIDLNSSK